jgi:hypothetical protein
MEKGNPLDMGQRTSPSLGHEVMWLTCSNCEAIWHYDRKSCRCSEGTVLSLKKMVVDYSGLTSYHPLAIHLQI